METNTPKIAKDNNFIGTFIWSVLTFCMLSLDDGAGLQNPVINQLSNFGFCQFAFFPSFGQILVYFHLTLVLDFFGAIRNVT